MTVLACFDLETTGTDVRTAEVVQAAFVSVTCTSGGYKTLSEAKALFLPMLPIPPEATAVHGISDADVADADGFDDYGHACDLSDALRDADVLLTFNGLAYDVPILERYIGAPLAHPCHVDVYRLWRRLQASDYTKNAAGLPASLMRGTLGAAYYWATGEELDGAHDALNDVRGTIDVMRAMLTVDPDTTWAELARLSQSPLPGFADLDGKLRWQGLDLTFTFGKHAGVPLRTCDPSYLRWVLGSDFPDDVKRIIRAVQSGAHPTPPTAD